jgi:hypothetical protein
MTAELHFLEKEKFSFFIVWLGSTTHWALRSKMQKAENILDQSAL